MAGTRENIFKLTMSSENSPGNPENDNIQTVTALKNSWVVCKSKTHGGRVYYFNTLTGEAAWNLCEVEREKAQKRTKILQNQPGSSLESCPEPKDPPQCQKEGPNNKHLCNKDGPYLCNMNPKQNQFTKDIYPSQQYTVTPYLNTQCVNCNSFNVPNGSRMTMHPPSAFNPNVWAYPPNHQIVYAPTTPLINQTHVAYDNMEQQVSVHNTSTPFMRRPNFQNDLRFDNRNPRFGQRNTKFTNRKNYMNVNQRRNNSHCFMKFIEPSTSNDLRQKLCERRSNGYNKINENSYEDADNYTFPRHKYEYEPKIQIYKPSAKEMCPIDVDDNWLKEHAYVEGTQLKLNVDSLKQIVMMDVKMGCWYIVADSNTLLDHFNFINIIVNSDEQCQLMVPDDTMAALQMASRYENSKLMSRAHLVLRLLSQQLTTGGAVMGKDSTKNSKNYSILDFTLNLAEQSHNVVLLCNSIETKEMNNNDIVPVFTIEEIKEILEDRCNPAKPKKEVVDPGYIKITIPNINPDHDINSCVSEENQIDSNIDKANSPKSNSNLNAEKTTLEMGVQTEFEYDSDKYTETGHTASVVQNSVDNKFVSNKTANSHSTESNSNTVNIQPKKREIRLKRNISQQSSLSVSENNTMKKRFKWRRRKKDVFEPPLESNESKVTDVFTANTDTSNQHPDFSVVTTDVFDEGNQTNEINQTHNYTTKEPCGDNFSDATSESYFVYKDNSKRTIIEETSTSGVISNTASIIDSESLYSVKQNISTNISNHSDDQQSNKCFMFEVENSVMEENLKMRSDEWLSRFVQIMEDILTQVLRLDPPFDHPSLRPPWSLHEAAECIKRKFHTDGHINDAASKLSIILYRNSNDRGIIDVQLNPTSFMEIYSFGVYLVDCLKAVLSNFEDLKTASESLAKLLDDIQCTTDSNNDSFTDNSNDPSANVTQCSSANSTEKEISCTNNTNTKKSTRNKLDSKFLEDIDECDGSIDFRSNETQNDAEADALQHVKFIRKIDIESTFFSSLKLHRIVPNNDSQASEKVLAEVIEPDPNEEVPDKDMPEPKIIRKFNKCLEFEERLKNKRNKLLDSLDYTENDQDGFYYDEEYNSIYDNYMNDENEDLSEIKSDKQTNEPQDINNEAIYDSKWIIFKTMNEVQQALLQMHAFCDNTREELNSSQPLSLVRKLKIEEQAKNAQVHLNNLFQSLNSIVDREDKEEWGANILSIFNEIGIFVDYSQAAEYRKVIGKSIEQAYILLESVNIVLEAVK